MNLCTQEARILQRSQDYLVKKYSIIVEDLEQIPPDGFSFLLDDDSAESTKDESAVLSEEDNGASGCSMEVLETVPPAQHAAEYSTVAAHEGEQTRDSEEPEPPRHIESSDPVELKKRQDEVIKKMAELAERESSLELRIQEACDTNELSRRLSWKTREYSSQRLLTS